LEALLTDSLDVSIELQNCLEASGWTRHRDDEIAECKAYRERVFMALATMQAVDKLIGEENHANMDE
jgi:hypothetical protein